ncbi:MAG: hypothetical protein EXR71_13840 [Myxococcales bacterium]|nr:hypothetical protein [Myxococcales bacterium]
MLVLLAIAAASPLLPQLADEGFAVGLAASTSTITDVLVDPACAPESACAAHRHRAGYGGALLLQVAPFVGAWLALGAETVTVTQAEYKAEGMALDGGLTVNLRPQADVGALLWASGAYATGGAEGGDNAQRWGVRVGGAARFGQPDDQAGAWVGGELVVPGRDLTQVLGGTVEVALVPVVPVSVTGGFVLWSPPLGVSTRDVPRAFFRGHASLGAENGLGVGVGATF